LVAGDIGRKRADARRASDGFFQSKIQNPKSKIQPVLNIFKNARILETLKS
jgi:hypothetical protein